MGGGRRLVVLLPCAVLAGFALSACGSTKSSTPQGHATRTTNKGCGAGCGNAGPAGAPAPPGQSGEVAQLGCHEYCKSAGGYGGGGGPSPPPAAKILSSGAVAVPSSDVVPVTVHCQISSPCRGAILVDFLSGCNSGSAPVGRSDLDVAAQGTRTIGVPLSTCQRGVLRSRNEVKAGITVDTGASGVCKQYDCVVPGEVTLRSTG
jgi:hypothetical protein